MGKRKGKKMKEAIAKLRAVIAGKKPEDAAKQYAAVCAYDDVPSTDLPGMWERSDFEGGRDEERGPAPTISHDGEHKAQQSHDGAQVSGH